MLFCWLNLVIYWHSRCRLCLGIDVTCLVIYRSRWLHTMQKAFLFTPSQPVSSGTGQNASYSPVETVCNEMLQQPCMYQYLVGVRWGMCMTCSYQIMPTQIPLVAAISAKPINGLKKDSSSCLQVVQSLLSQITKCLDFTSSDNNRWVGMGRVGKVTKTRIRSGRLILWPKLAGKSI